MGGSRSSLTLTIRPASASDAGRLAELRWEFRSGRAPPAESREAFLARCAEWMHDRLTSAQWRCWVALRADAIVGHVWVRLIEKIPNPATEPEWHAYITNLYVEPAARGGTGGALMDATIAWCAAQDIDAVFLWPTNQSRTLYMRKGFNSTPDIMAQRRPPDA